MMATQLATSAASWPFLSPMDFGAQLNGANDIQAVIRCLTASHEMGLPVVDYRTYDIGGTADINLPDGLITIGALKLRQIQPDAPDRRTLMVRGGVRLVTKSLTIDRGDDGKAGAINDAAALWLTDGSGHSIGGLEVFGASKGQALVVTGTTDVTVDRPYIHDLSFDEPDATDDVVQGIWFEKVNYSQIISPKIHRLTGNVPGHPLWRSRGIALGECFHVNISNSMIHDCDQAIDITGANNRMVTVTGGNLDRCASWGGKAANSALYCKFLGVTASNCGLSGFVASGPSHSGLVGTQGTEFADCVVIDPGGDPRGQAVGFLVLEQDIDPSYPRKTTFRDSAAFDLRPTKIMTHGFLNRVPGNGSRVIDCDSYGHTVAATEGF